MGHRRGVGKGPRQRTVATLGKAPAQSEEERIGWEQVADELSGRRSPRSAQRDLFAEPAPEVPDWAHVDLARVRVERLRYFGDVYLALALWRRLRLDEFFAGRIEPGREDVPWAAMAALHAVGRLLEKHQRASRLFTATITEVDDPGRPGSKRLHMELRENTEAAGWTALQNGCYLLRTNLAGRSPEELWRAYTGLTEAEAAFRALKGPLGLRPVHHQKTERVDAHILVCFLALAMRRTRSLWMRESGLGTAPDKLLAAMKDIHSLDVVLTAREQTELRLRLVGTPEEGTRALLHALRLRLPSRPKRLQNVVPTPPVQIAQNEQAQEA